jgi:hypothetical protein
MRRSYRIPEIGTIFQRFLHWLDCLVVGNATGKSECWWGQLSETYNFVSLVVCELTHHAITYRAHSLSSNSLRRGQ